MSVTASNLVSVESRGKSVAPVKRVSGKTTPPLRLNTRAEVREYLAEHLTPVRFGPKGQPIYAQSDIEKLNVIIRPGV